jgi:short-subunit dehydrogenase
MNIVITGASKGLGKAIAARFAKDGIAHNLYLNARNEAILQATVLELSQHFTTSNFYYKACDMSNKKEVQIFAEWVLQQTNSIDILINNAGSFTPGSVHSEADGVLEQMIETNLYSAYWLTKLLLPVMMKQQSGHIFNMCSIASLQAYANGGSYSISKFALAGFSKNLREELKPHNIKVTAVYPGAVYTDSWANSGVDEKRLMQANDVAEMIVIASKLSPQACVEDIILRPQLGDL